MRRVYGIALVLPVVLLTANGCVATRNWVNETVGKRADEIDQRVAIVDTARRQDVTRLDQHGQRLEGVEVSLSEAKATAKGAQTKADEVDNRLTRLWDKRNVRSLSESHTVQFGFNRAELDDKGQTALGQLVRDLQQNPKLLVELEGYADPKGAREYNVQLSQRRVEAVRRYLVQNGIELARINSIGLGAIDDPKTSDAAKRRVTVKVMVLAD